MPEETAASCVTTPEPAVVSPGISRASWGQVYLRRLDQAPLRAKVAVLVLASVVFGVLVGMAEVHLGQHIWPLMVGLTLVGGALIVAGQHWVCGPMDRLLARLDRLSQTRTTNRLKDLPTDRTDEVGRIAVALHELASASLRCDNETRRLRRTMHSSIDKATRRATHRLREIAMRDPLTNLGNRRFLDEQLPALVDATRESGTELVCVMMDMDNFKAVNDALGHAEGDRLLRLIGQLIAGSARQGDMSVRLGGDEFVVFMPGADRGRARMLADHVRMHFRQQTRVMHPQGPHADISAGVAAMLADDLGDAEALMARADHRLYRAKGAGKGVTDAGSRGV